MSLFSLSQIALIVFIELSYQDVFYLSFILHTHLPMNLLICHFKTHVEQQSHVRQEGQVQPGESPLSLPNRLGVLIVANQTKHLQFP